MAEAGAGLEIKIHKGVLFCIQGKVAADFPGNNLNGFIPVSSTLQYFPYKRGSCWATDVPRIF